MFMSNFRLGLILSTTILVTGFASFPYPSMDPGTTKRTTTNNTNSSATTKADLTIRVITK